MRVLRICNYANHENKIINRLNSIFGIFIVNLNNITLFAFTSLLTALIISFSLIISTKISGYNQEALNNPVNPKTCTCDCWDGFFRGIHGKVSTGGFYKMFYFNFNPITIVILFIFLTYAQLLKEVLTKIVKLLFHDCKQSRFLKSFSKTDKFLCLRYGFLINLLIAIYSNYYGIWNIINYLNDQDYRMIKSQLFFSISELIPGYLYFKCLNRFDLNSGNHNKITLQIVYPILVISILHIYLAICEQILWGFFTSNVVEASRNKLRDILLIINDVSGILLSIFYIIKIKKENMISKNNLSQYGHLYYLKHWIFIFIFFYIFYKKYCTF